MFELTYLSPEEWNAKYMTHIKKSHNYIIVTLDDIIWLSQKTFRGLKVIMWKGFFLNIGPNNFIVKKNVYLKDKRSDGTYKIIVE